MTNRTLLNLVAALACCAPQLGAAAARDGLYVPSPDWRDQVIYFAMIDRFADGDPANNDQGVGEYDPASPAHYSGGDLEGLIGRLDYIRGLGATALWITPPVAHQWWDDSTRYGGYHGYWAQDFRAIDRHFGDLDDYRRLARELHARGMFLVQDIVVNHTGNYFRYPDAWSPDDPAEGYTPNPDRLGRAAPARAPFSLNDPRDPAQRAASIYHWTPVIRDANNRAQELTFQLADLDDLDTENPRVRRALRESYGYWIREVGVDAFRVDTAYYVPPEFFADFLDSVDARAPGIRRVAAATGRRDFHVFGEGFGLDPPYGEAQARKIDTYLRDRGGRALLPGMLNFPLYGTTLDVFARGAPTAAMSHRIANMMRVHADPHRMPSFVDNHDVDRFLAGGSEAALRQALLLVMTLPGIPTIYYGTEQGYTVQRAAMFAHGYRSGGRDRYDTSAALYRYLRRLTALRREERTLSRGSPTPLADSAAGPGVLAYRMSHGADTLVVVLNSADTPVLVDRLETGLAAGTALDGVFAIEGAPRDFVLDADGAFALELEPRAGLVFRAEATRRRVATAVRAASIDALSTDAVEDELELHGETRGITDLVLVVDGDLAHAVPVRAGSDGRWSARVETASYIDPSVEHRVVAWSPSRRVASAPRRFRVARRWTVLAERDDPPGDDHGPNGAYRYPPGSGWSRHRPLDLRRVRVLGSGGSLRVELTLASVIASWNPPNGFDHVAFTAFVALPGVAPSTDVMPLQNAVLPDGMRWTHRLRVHGWSNAWFTAAGASATDEGTPRVPGASIAVDRDAATVTLTVPAAALGHPRALAGARVHVTTWDYDGGYRALTPGGSSHGFAGGDGRRDPLVMDEAGIITLH